MELTEDLRWEGEWEKGKYIYNWLSEKMKQDVYSSTELCFPVMGKGRKRNTNMPHPPHAAMYLSALGV